MGGNRRSCTGPNLPTPACIARKQMEPNLCRIQELRLPQISRGFSTEILLHKIAAGGPAGGVIATALAIVCLYSRCHDEVPYTKRERIMLVKKSETKVPNMPLFLYRSILLDVL